MAVVAEGCSLHLRRASPPALHGRAVLGKGASPFCFWRRRGLSLPRLRQDVYPEAHYGEPLLPAEAVRRQQLRHGTQARLSSLGDLLPPLTNTRRPAACSLIFSFAPWMTLGAVGVSHFASLDLNSPRIWTFLRKLRGFLEGGYSADMGVEGKHVQLGRCERLLFVVFKFPYLDVSKHLIP